MKNFADFLEQSIKEYLDFESEQGVQEIFGELDSSDSEDSSDNEREVVKAAA
jgi:hypothetical protein